MVKKVLHFLKCSAIITSVVERRHTVGVDDAGGPPVPIPNTEVKPCSAEDTWLATARENRKMPTRYKGFHPIGWLFFYTENFLPE